jgi:hypothetical protein
VLSQALSVAAAKAKLTGLVVAAAAVGSTTALSSSGTFVPTAGEDTVLTEASPSPEATVEASPAAETTTTTVEPTSTATLPPCTGEEKNHGAYVSSVAKDKTVTGRDHGKLVSEAAKSDCGKQAGEDGDEQEQAAVAEAPEVEATEAPETEDGDTDEAKKDDKAGKKNEHGRRVSPAGGV